MAVRSCLVLKFLTCSSQPNARKGALLCLAAAIVGIGNPTEAHLRQIVPPVMHSFADQDSRVRYYACGEKDEMKEINPTSHESLI